MRGRFVKRPYDWRRSAGEGRPPVGPAVWRDGGTQVPALLFFFGAVQSGRGKPLPYGVFFSAAADRRADDIRPYAGAERIRPASCNRRVHAAQALREAPLRSSRKTKAKLLRASVLKGANGGADMETAFQTETGVPRETPVSERKKDSADVQFSRLLRKPRKRNGAEFF